MPFVQWRKEKTQEVVTPKRRAPEVVMLTISPVTEADLGNYTCVAENSQCMDPETQASDADTIIM